MIRTALLAAVVLGCQQTAPYTCTDSSECVLAGATGMCLQGSCAFPDPGCPGGYRYEQNAGSGLAGTCTETEPSCGQIGQACCAGDAPCVGGASCDSGTCQECVKDVALGRRFSCVLDRNHAVSCAGENQLGQLSTGMVGAPSASRVAVRDNAGPITDATAIAAGRDFACAVRSGGSVWCWGANNVSQVGNGTASVSVNTASRVVAAGNAPLANIVEVVAGYNHSCARDSMGAVWCWGRNAAGELGDGTVTARAFAAPVLAAPAGAPFSGATGLAIGSGHTCARKANNEAWCWGDGTSGEFGDGTANNRLVPGLVATTTSIGLGRAYTCYVNADSTVSCHGWSVHGRLGLGDGTQGYWDNSNHLTPAHVQNPDGSDFTGAKQVFAGGVSCAIRTDNSVMCWSDNQYGQSGTGAGSTTPSAVRFLDGTLLAGVERLVVNHDHVCAHRTSGDWLCWGRDAQGDLGDGRFVNVGFPMPLKASCP